MGSRINLSGAAISHQLKDTSKYLPEKSQRRLKSDIDIVINEGKLGFNLLEESLYLLFASGFILIIFGIVSYPKGSRSNA